MRHTAQSSVVLLFLMALPSMAAADPLLKFAFNETGTTSASTGSDSAAVNFQIYNGTANVPADLHTAAGLGVAGDIAGSPLFGADRAFDGTGASFGVGLNTTDTGLVGFKSWTISGWYKSPAVISGGGKVIFNTTPSGVNFNNEGFDARIGLTAGTLRLTSGGNLESSAVWQDSNKWVFFAMTYDGTATSNNVKFYRGYRNAAEAGANPVGVTLLETLTRNGGTVPGTTTTGFFVGGYVVGGNTSQTFPGFLDNIRVDGTTADAGAALSLAALESYRSADVVPEPGAAGVAAFGGLVWAMGRRPRRRGAK